jgi:3-methyladenine DNA glycosylase AlkD
MENQLVQEFHVTYFDADCGRIRAETFDTREEAERFADRSCTGEDSWAVIDTVAVQQARIAA